MRPLLLRLLRVLRSNPKGGCLFLLSLFLYFLYKFKRRTIGQIGDGRAKKKVDPRPLLAFSGSALLLAYYNGIAGYLKDHFELDNVRFSGISGGCVFFLPILLGVPVDKMFASGMYVRKRIMKRPLLCYLLTEAECVSMFLEELKLMGLTDKNMKDLSEQNRGYFGVTTCKWLAGLIPTPSPRLIPVSDTMESTIKGLLQSTCTPPFFRSPGKLEDGKYAIDGVFSMTYAIPDDADEEKIIRISPWTFYPADVKPSRLRRMHLVDFFLPLGIKHQTKQFCVGYKTAWENHQVFVKKGLKPKPYSTNPRKCLKEHVASFQNSAISAQPRSEEDHGGQRPTTLLRPSSMTKVTEMQLKDELNGPLSPVNRTLIQTAKSGSSGMFTIEGSANSSTDFKDTMDHVNSIWRKFGENKCLTVNEASLTNVSVGYQS